MFLWGQSIRTCATDIRRSSFLPAHVQKREPKEQREQKRRKKKHIAKHNISWRKVFLLLHPNFSVLSSQRNEMKLGNWKGQDEATGRRFRRGFVQDQERDREGQQRHREHTARRRTPQWNRINCHRTKSLLKALRAGSTRAMVRTMMNTLPQMMAI